MIRIWMIAGALLIALATPTAAQPQSIPNIVERLRALCDQDYKPACIKLGLVIGRIPPRDTRSLRREHPEWWWWERW